MDKRLQLKLKDNLIVASLEGEGLIFDLDTWKTFWINETAASLLNLLRGNEEGASLFHLKKWMEERYPNKNDGDFDSFINQLQKYGLAFFQPTTTNKLNEIQCEGFDSEKKNPYSKPIIEEERETLLISGARVRAARMAAVRQQAAQEAKAIGFRPRA